MNKSLKSDFQSKSRNLKAIMETLNKIKCINLNSYTDEMLLDYSKKLLSKAQKGISVDDLMIASFALVNEAIIRVLGYKPFDVQIMAGIALHERKLIEMQTGEGKTLAAVFPAYLNALTAKGVHVLTVNDYLARRDAEWMGPVYSFLGLSVGYVQEGMELHARQKAYGCDITYVTAKEAGFDFLRDSLCYDKKEQVHRPFHYTIVDEADSIMIDEARIPLVIAAGTTEERDSFDKIYELISLLIPEIDYKTDEYSRNIFLTDVGIQKSEKQLNCGNLYDNRTTDLLSKIHNALHAAVLLKRDIDYIVNADKIELVDEFTGRVSENRHWPDGLQAAVEAKEGLNVNTNGRIMNSITMHNFIRLYPGISGMTGTAASSSDEFMDFYGLDTVVIPTNKQCIRMDHPDLIFPTKDAKYKALLSEITDVNNTGRPILIGTCSIAESEKIAFLLEQSGMHCQVLNAKNDELEAKIIANAGALFSVTVSTNMAGRGTDIKLGGPEEYEKDKVIALGGLYVVGTNRHESVRIDNQLRGRAGRQGDPGSTRFYISLQDEVLVKYGVDRIVRLNKCAFSQEAPINLPKVTRGVLQAQRTIEGQNYDIRKILWKYSNMIEIQRKHMLKKRSGVLSDSSIPSLFQECEPVAYNHFLSVIGQGDFQRFEKQITLYTIDQCWSDYLAQVTYIRDGIHLVAVAGQNPLEEYLIKVSQVFRELETTIQACIINTIKTAEITKSSIDSVVKDLKGPSATWTYLINDNPFADDLGLMLASTRNIGFAAFAVALPLVSPFMIISLLYQRFIKKGRHIE